MFIKPQVHNVFLLTLGCAKNEVDSREMQKQLHAHGFAICEDPEEADFLLLNTCAFIEAAVEESLDAIMELAALACVKEGRAQLLVTGCLPSRYGEKLIEELPEVAAFVPVEKEVGIVELLSSLVPPKENNEVLAVPSGAATRCLDTALSTVMPWAYVKISDGCSRSCSYCTIPLIRGSYRSYPFKRIRADVEELIREGVREIILVGQDTGIWHEPTRYASSASREEGSCEDAAAPCGLSGLLDALATEYATTWFRVMYLQPEGVTNELLKVMAAHANIAPYLDIPLQHASSGVLRRMHRNGSGEEYLALLERIRSALPKVALRTTVMCGFPGETHKDFEELCAFLKAACFDYVGVFAFSPEEGTCAAELPGRVAKKTTLKRVQRVRDLADSIGFERAERYVGAVRELLICGQDEEAVYGRMQSQAPDVDGITYLSLSKRPSSPSQAADVLQPGLVVRARIIESVLYDLYAEVL